MVSAVQPRSLTGALEHKLFAAEVKTASDAGEFTALVSAFGNVDRGGDRVMKGAFGNVLARLRREGNPLPVIVSHNHDDPMAVIGKADPNQITETDAGLEVNGSLDLSNPTAKQVHKLMKEGLLRAFSFAYQVAKDGQKSKDGVNEITEISDLFEVGPTLVGMNSEARLQTVKAITSQEESPPEAKDMASMGRRMAAMATEMQSSNPPDPAAMARRMRAMATEMEGMMSNSATAEIEDVKIEEPPEAKSSSQDLLRRKVRRIQVDALRR